MVRVVGWVSDNVLSTAIFVVLLLCFISFTYEMKNKEIMMISQFIGKGLQLLFQKGRTNWKTNYKKNSKVSNERALRESDWKENIFELTARKLTTLLLRQRIME